ncbi:MAG TPA: glycoside hydrolase family 2 TIM barrel-domain containing protein [Thermoguttaceae bacterium]|nr:glycoside hydrolase family 2 TIM barrel-domain containing protein [Thermoguttaceae bacterium]
MRYRLILIALLAPFAGVAIISFSASKADDWKPAKAALMTRWAKDVSPENAHPEYPRPQMVRDEWLNLNGVWQLETTATDGPPPVGKDLPEQILVPFPIESALSGVMKRTQRAWYRRTFEVPTDWQDSRVLLHFQAVDWEATVWVNGTQVRSHRGGYDPFSIDITDALNPSGKQELIVKVFDPSSSGDQPRGKQVDKPQGIYYTPSTGIWQTVWLEPVPSARIGRIKLVPDVDNSCLRLIVEGIGTDATHSIVAVARDGDVEVASAVGRVGAELRLDIPSSQLKLWSPDTPVLYDLSVTLQEKDAAVDEVASYFGMRKIDLARDDDGFMRMRLNGEFVFQNGPLDQGFWPDGLYTAPTDEALRYDIEVTRQLGFNMTRKHVKVEPDRWYYWCDKLGLLVWQDMPSGKNKTPESRQQFETELRRMVEGMGNHPSIIMWVVFNEGWGQHDTPRYVENVKKMDPSRLVSNASGWTDKACGDILDIHSYPGPDAPTPEPNRAGVLGEFGGLGLGVDGHTWTEKTWGYRGTASSNELTRRYVDLLRGVWEFEQTHGLSAAVYTQITDVETECNGLLTYDRAVLKVDAMKVAAANRGQIPRRKVVLPASRAAGVMWRYVFDTPEERWIEPDFDDASWNEGLGGFGTEDTPGGVVRTEWSGEDIWLRREFELHEMKAEDLELLVHHDEDVEIHINGVLAAKAVGFTTAYEAITISPKALATICAGKNVLAVHCKQTRGGQYIDVGIVAESTLEN